MARYDLSKIMKRAHNLYKNAHAKYPTFADALRKSWSMAKFEVRVAEARQAIEAEEKAREAKEREEKEQAAINSVLLRAQIEADRIRREAETKAERMRAEIAARKRVSLTMSIKTALVVQWATGVDRIAVTNFLFIIIDLFS